MKNKIFLVIVVLVMISTINNVSAFRSVDTCFNQTHATSVMKVENFGVLEYDYQQVPNFCPYGCNNISGQCNPIPETTTYYHAIGISLLILVMYLLFVIIKTNPKKNEGL